MAGEELAGAAAGASVGASAAVPWLGLASAGMNVLGGALRSGSAAPSSADPYNSVGLDFSNWTVSTHGATAKGGTSGIDIPPWLILGGAVLVAVVAVRWIAKKH